MQRFPSVVQALPCSCFYRCGSLVWLMHFQEGRLFCGVRHNRLFKMHLQELGLSAMSCHRSLDLKIIQVNGHMCTFHIKREGLNFMHLQSNLIIMKHIGHLIGQVMSYWHLFCLGQSGICYSKWIMLTVWPKIVSKLVLHDLFLRKLVPWLKGCITCSIELGIKGGIFCISR